MKTLLPWVLVIALSAGAGYLYSDSRKKDAAIATLTAEHQELETVRAENATLKSSQVSNDEVARLRKDAEDALRLRNEVTQLRKDKQLLTHQVQQQASKVTTLGTQALQAQQLQNENELLKANAQKVQQARNMNVCINNLRVIDGAKQQWALENKKTETSVPQWRDILPYTGKADVQPTCPDGGTYTLGTVVAVPTCSIPGHTLAQQ